jgi:hypothetical protein
MPYLCDKHFLRVKFEHRAGNYLLSFFVRVKLRGRHLLIREQQLLILAIRRCHLTN